MIPDRIYLVFAMPFWLIHPRCHSALVVPAHGIYHIIRKDCDFWLPSPKEGQGPVPMINMDTSVSIKLSMRM